MNDNNGSFLTGFVLGGLIGAAIALIFAPQSGVDVRASFGNRGVTLNQAVKRPVNGDGNHLGESTKSAAPISYEPPRIILDEENGASMPPTA